MIKDLGKFLKGKNINIQILHNQNLDNLTGVGYTASKKIGNAVKRNRIKRKLRSIVIKLLKINNLIDLNYIYIIFGKEKAYKEYHDSLFEKMKKSFKRIEGLRV